MLSNKLIIILMSSIALSLIITMLVYNKLPNEIPIHYNSVGEAYKYRNKNAIFISGVLPLLILLLMIAISKFDKNKEPYQKNYILYNIITWFITLFAIAIHWLVLTEIFYVS